MEEDGPLTAAVDPGRLHQGFRNIVLTVLPHPEYAEGVGTARYDQCLVIVDPAELAHHDEPGDHAGRCRNHHGSQQDGKEQVLSREIVDREGIAADRAEEQDQDHIAEGDDAAVQECSRQVDRRGHILKVLGQVRPEGQNRREGIDLICLQRRHDKHHVERKQHDKCDHQQNHIEGNLFPHRSGAGKDDQHNRGYGDNQQQCLHARFLLPFFFPPPIGSLSAITVFRKTEMITIMMVMT